MMSRLRIDLDATRIGRAVRPPHHVSGVGGQRVGVEHAERWLQIRGGRL